MPESKAPEVISNIEPVATTNSVDTMSPIDIVNNPINNEQEVKISETYTQEEQLPSEGQDIEKEQKSEIDEIPDWLKDITYSQEEKKEEVTIEKNTTILEKSPHLEEIPDWLKESVQPEEK